MVSKRDLRQKFLDKRLNMSKDAVIEANQKLNARLERHLQNASGIWAAYMPHKNEADPWPTIRRLSTNIKWAFPVVVGDQMDFWVPDTLESFAPGYSGILEPLSGKSRKVAPHDLSGLLVPGVAFDSHGTRLGYGKGFYDRYLRNINISSIGLAFEVQISNEPLPKTSQDIAVTEVLTEDRALVGTSHK